MKTEEIEIKLSLPPDQANSFRRSTLLRDHKQGRAKTTLLVSTYFDTPDLLLRKNRMALRIRKSGQAREQTLKWTKRFSAGLQSRNEFNTPVASDGPDLSVLDVPEFAALPGLLSAAKVIAPIFATHIRRTTWMLGFNGSTIEVALDEGDVRSGARSHPISEIELELVEGKPVDLIDLAILFARRLTICPEVDSKAGRGYALFLNKQPKAKKIKPPVLKKSTPVWIAFQGYMRAGVKQVLTNRPVILNGDNPDGVHQARVAVRRMRSALSVFKPVLNEGALAKARTELRWMQQELGPARDWDVFLDETINPLIARMPDNQSLRRLAKAVHGQQSVGYERARAGLQSHRFATSVLWFERWFLEVNDEAVGKQPLPDFAARLLNKIVKKIRKKAGPDILQLQDGALHALRIELKKLRYVALLFKSLYPRKKTQHYLQCLSALQDCLGGLNDAAVQQGLLEQLKEAGTPVDRQAQSIILGWHAARTEAGLDHLQELWEEFDTAKAFWR